FPEHLDIQPLAPFNIDSDPLVSIFGNTAQRKAIQKYGIAGRFGKFPHRLEAAHALHSYVRPAPASSFDPPFPTPGSNRISVLELGSGLGMISSSIIRMLTPQDIFIATDLPEVCPLLRENLKQSSGAAHRVRPLAWGNEKHGLDIALEFFTPPKHPLTHIICSDLVYFPELLAPLLRSLLQLTSPPFKRDGGKDVAVIISYKIRSLAKEAPFWFAFGLWFDFKPVLFKDSEAGSWERFGASFDDTTFIFTATRRPESFGWDVPSNDQDLLDGVGGWGTSTKKGDETFESLLLLEIAGTVED
ncbi:hypothetical protein BD779DRAFT_1433255, partial [Infundibulicybe gibba]